MSVLVEVIGPGGDVVDVVELEPAVAVRLAGPTVRLVHDAAPPPPADPVEG